MARILIVAIMLAAASVVVSTHAYASASDSQDALQFDP